ncbi:MAG: LPXTG cell wall anchor domain-containing protein [Atopobiaceae bacterium]|nr:LPXTG cell wall anchor domain-containing protein [Atopobiaceae bacterium]
MQRRLQFQPSRRAGAFALALVLVGGLSFPTPALAAVVIDETELAQGENAVGGGTATLAESVLDMVDVTAGYMSTDEDLTVNFNGGNSIETVSVEGSANVEMNFSGDNEVEDIQAIDDSTLTVNANGHNEFEELNAYNHSNVTVNVTGDNEFEEIQGFDYANVTVRGTDCQKKDVIELGEGEDHTSLSTQDGKLTIDHVTVNVEAKSGSVRAEYNDLVIDTSKIASGDDTEHTQIMAGGALKMSESVIDITGTVFSFGMMTIDHSDVKVEAPSSGTPLDTYRVWSSEGIELIDEENGEVKAGAIGDIQVAYVDTGDEGMVDLQADGEPAYYKCKSGVTNPATKSLPRTGDTSDPMLPLAIALTGVGAAALGIVARRRLSVR